MHPPMLRARPWLVLVAVLFPLEAPAADDRLDRIIDASGYEAQIEHLPVQMIAGLRASLMSAEIIDETGFAALEREMFERLDIASLRSALRDDLAARLDAARIETLDDWFSSDTAARLTAAEVAAGEPAAMAEMAQIGPKLLADAERVALSQQILERQDSVELVVELQRRSAIGTFMVLSTKVPAHDRQTLAEFEQQLDEQTPFLRLQLAQGMLVSIAYAYRDFESDVLEDYVDILGTDAFRILVERVNEDFMAVASLMLEVLLEDLDARLPELEQDDREDAA